MARLRSASRSDLPTRDFAGPGRSYPIEDTKHARAAIMDSAAGVRAGNITPATRKRIVARADKKLRGSR